jgi:hypothetical protein
MKIYEINKAKYVQIIRYKRGFIKRLLEEGKVAPVIGQFI